MKSESNSSRFKNKLKSTININLNTSRINFNKLMEFIDRYYIILACIVIAFIAYLCFRNIGTFSIKNWDESRHGVNGYEMIKNNEYIVNTYAYEKDFWNLKPPLSFWLIALFIKIFGVSIFAIRFYSAASLLITTIIIAVFMLRKYGKMESIISLLGLCASIQLYVSHVGRHGDADALYLLLFTISMISMLYIKENKKKLYLCGFVFGLAFLTKSLHAGTIAIIGGLFLIITGEIKKIKLKEWVIFISSFVIPIGAWIIARVAKDGFFFFEQMIRYDLVARTVEGVEKNTPGVFFYFEYFFIGTGSNLRDIFTLIIVMGIFLYVKECKQLKEEIIAYALWFFIPLIIYTISETKLEWYIVPIYMPVIIVSSVLLSKMIKDENLGKLLKITFLGLFVAVVIGHSAYMINFVEQPTSDDLQNFIMNDMSNNNQINGKIAYIDIGLGMWEQSTLLASEIGADLKCKEGGTKGFINSNEESILIISNIMYKIHKNELKDFDLILENEEYYIIYKS